jgi:uncharacterized protein YerC
MHDAYVAGWKTMPGLAEACGLSLAHVSRVIRRVEWGGGEWRDLTPKTS